MSVILRLIYEVFSVIWQVLENVSVVKGSPLYSMSAMYRFDCNHETLFYKLSDDLFSCLEFLLQKIAMSTLNLLVS